MRDRKKDRGFYKPKSYRLSGKHHKFLKELGKKHGSLEKAVGVLITNYKSK